MDLDNINNLYIIGIEGAGTSALACILKAQGKNVVGSDEGDHFYYDVLKKAGIKVFHEFNKDNLKNAFGNKDERGKRFGLGEGEPFRRERKTRPDKHPFGRGPNLEERELKNKIDLIIYSTAVQPETNAELKYAMEIASKAGASKAGPLERNDSEARGPAFSERNSDEARGPAFPSERMFVRVGSERNKKTRD